MSYNAEIYREQGSTKLVAASGGEIEMQSGSVFDQQSGSSATFAGTLNVTGVLKNSKTETLSTAAAAVANSGLSILATTKAGVYTLAAPTAGIEKEIVFNSTFLIKLKGSTADTVRFGSTAGGTVLTITPTSKGDANFSGPAIRLRGGSAKLWYIMSASTVAVASATAT